MTTTNDGGPAFPRPISTDEHATGCNILAGQDGMTLRDYFAAAALTGLLASCTGGDAYTAWPLAAEDAYRMADAMLGERVKGD